MTKKRCQKRLGATAVEFAIASIVLFLVVFGTIEVTRVSMLRHTADHAAYLAARDAIISGATTADVKLAAQEHLASVGVKSASVVISPDPIVESTSSILVRVEFPAVNNSLVLPQFITGDIVGTCELLTERSPAQMATALPEPPPPPPTLSLIHI